MADDGLDPRSVLARVATVLDAFTVQDDALSLAELTRRTGLPKSTLHRLLGDLAALRWVERSGETYRLGSGLFEIGLRASVERGLLEVAIPFLQDLYVRTRETVHLGVRESVDVVYVEKIGGHRQAAAPSRIGGRMPLHCTAVGKALLAHSPPAVLAARVDAGLPRLAPRTVTAAGLLRRQLTRIRDDGVAYEHEESAVGINCVAAVVLDAAGQPLAAVSITGPTTRFRPEDHAHSVRAAASGIAATLARRAEAAAARP